MKFEIVTHSKNPLMKRDEYMVSLDHTGKPTPKRDDIAEHLAKELKAEKDVVLIDKIYTSTGRSVSSLKIFVYHSKDSIPKYKLEKLERKAKKKKKGQVEAAPAEAAPAQAPAKAEGSG